MDPKSQPSKTEEIARKWRALAQRRREHLTELYRSGRYRRYFTEESLLRHMRDTVKTFEGWEALAKPAARESTIERALQTLERGPRL